LVLGQKPHPTPKTRQPCFRCHADSKTHSLQM